MNQYGTAAYYTLGCKLNFSETSTISQSLTDSGYAKVEFDSGADVYVINTCSVTESANKKCRNIVRKALNYNPEAFVVVIGCYAQLKPQEIADIKGVDLVLGANEKFNVGDYLNDLHKRPEAQILANEIKETKEFVPGFSTTDRTRSFLKIQDGCNYFCSFCTIPLARGRGRNASIKDTLEKANELAKTDVKEVVLTGVNIGDFGYGTEENFFGLIQELDKIEDVERFRISSIEPNLLSNEIIEFVSKSQRFVPHFHIPLQSGSDVLLKSMRRRYDSSLYVSRVEKIKELMPDACIGVDVIVGFPGETDELFLETYNYLNELDISYLHVFTYSERPGTLAAKKMIDDVPFEVKKRRLQEVIDLQLKHSLYRTQQHLGKIEEFLIEGESKKSSEHWKARNTQNTVVIFPKGIYKVGEFVDVKIEDCTSATLFGTVVGYSDNN